jgi:putative acetyltransferase
MVYVLPDCVRYGVGRALVEALARLAGARGVKKLTVEASDNAQPFFEALGFVAQQRATRILDDEFLGYMVMHRDLVPHPVAPTPAPTDRLS